MPPQEKKSVIRKGLLQVSAVTFFAVALSYLIERSSYLFFHSVVEILSTVILWSIFILAFNTRRFLKTSYFIFLGTGFLFVGIFDVFHTLAFKGMNIFAGSGSGNLATQLWIAMRYLLGLSYLLAPFFIRKKIGFRPLLAIFSMVTALLLLAILWKPVFPACYIPGTGLTLFKITSEYIICLMLLASGWLMHRNRTAFHADVFRYLMWSISLAVATELSFTLYNDIFGLFNTLGHILEILAFLAAYKAVIKKGLNHPHDLIFFDMKRHEAALSESEQRYRSLFNSMSEGFALHEIICDDHGTPCDYRFLDVNPAFEQMTGLKRRDVVGRLHNELLPGDDPRWVAEYGAVALTGKSIRFENYSPALRRHYDVSAYRPAPLQFATVFMDITERKRAEEALQESEERLTFAMETTQTGVWDLDLIDHTAGRSLMHDRIFGYGSLLPKWTFEIFLEHVLPEDREEVSRRFRHAIETKTNWEFECRIRRADGEVRWIWAGGRHRRDAAGVLRWMSGVVQDITRRKAAEEALRTSERLYRAIGESIDYGIWVCDAQGRNTYASESFLKLVGITQKQCSDMGWGDVLHPDDTEATIAAWKECVRKGGPWYREHRFRGADGQWHPVLACGVPVRDERGEVTAWAGINLDISRLKLAEQTAADLAAKVLMEKERLIALINSTPDEIWFADADGKFSLLNPAAKQAFNLDDKADINVEKLAESLEVFRENGAHRPVEESPPLRALRGEIIKGETEIIRLPSTGGLHYRQVNSAPVYDSGKRIIGSISVVRDITDLKKSEETLRQSETRLQAALLAGRAFIFEWHPRTDEVYRSEHCGPILGIAPQNCTRDTGRNFFEQIHPEDRAGFKELVQTLTPAAPEYKTEYRYIQPNGQAVWLEERGRSDFDKNGHLTRLHGITTDVTDRVEAHRREREAIAAASAARSASEIVNAMDEGVVLMQLDGTIIDANPAALVFAGLQAHDVAGKNVMNFLPALLSAEDLAMASSALVSIAQKQTPSLRTIMLKRPQGLPLYIIPAVTFVESPQSPAKVVVTLKDITALHENTEILERVFDNSHISIVYLDSKFNFIRVNSTYAADCGHPEDFFPGKNHFTLYPHEENEQIFRQVVASGRPYTVYDKPFEFPDHPEWGISYWDWSLQPIKGEQGQVEALIFCLQNTTVRKTAQLALEESERKYRELVENANSIIMRITADHRITFFNEYAETFFGYTEEEVIGRSVLETIVPAVDSYGKDLSKMLESVTAYPDLFSSNENENICKDGRRVWISWTNKVVRDENGRIKEILCVGKDATRRKQVQDENLRYQERLRGLAEQLAASEELERWQISRYIHDTVVQNLSLSSLKLGGIRNSLINAGLDQTASTLTATRTLIDDAIDECRNAMSELTPPLLYELGLIPALIDFAERLKERHDIPVIVEKSREHDDLSHTLRGLLFQSVRELIMNALKHAECSRVHVSVLHNNGVQASVQDDGCGFDSSTLSRHKAGRSGFGLFSVRERVETLGGRLEILSERGRGTTVKIFMPFQEGGTPADSSNP